VHRLYDQNVGYWQPDLQGLEHLTRADHAELLFVEEGDLQGLMDAIDIVVQKNPRYLLHGHEPLTRNFASASMLAQLKIDLAWLREQVLTATRRGHERGAIHQANLIPPGLLNDQPDVYQPYLILREHVIDLIIYSGKIREQTPQMTVSK